MGGRGPGARGSVGAASEGAIDPSFTVGDAEEGRAIYLDFQATTPTDPRVTDAMLPWMLQGYGNPHSRVNSRAPSAPGPS